jgi:pimeloyl-ACP methyl ester carboxylesterase
MKPSIYVTLSIAIFSAPFCSSMLSDLIPLRARGGDLYANLVVQEHASDALNGILRNSTPNYFNQLIWHNDSSKGTFKQRWFIDYTFWNGSGPVFLNIGGEGPAGGSPGGYTAVLGQSLGALLLTIEHRYYGDSFPAPLSDRSTLETLQVDTVMNDLAAFVQYIQKDIIQSTSLPFLAIGGSYSGALSAWFRQKHPELVAASWSSSGVVNAVYNFTEFDHQVVIDVDEECKQALFSVTAAFDKAWDDVTTRPSLLQQFGTPSYFTKGDMAWMLADSAAMGAQYGGKAQLCSALVPSTDPLAQFAAYTKARYGPNFGSGCYYSTKCLSDPSMSDQWIAADYQWVSQCCKELAYWQIHDSMTYRSDAITLEYYNEQCQSAFGFDPSSTNQAFNERYFNQISNATNIIALNGSDDPWKNAAVTTSFSPSYVSFTATCDGCGHCGDLSGGGNNPAIAVQHAAISTYVSLWLSKA